MAYTPDMPIVCRKLTVSRWRARPAVISSSASLEHMSTSEGPFPMETTYTWQETPNGGTKMVLRAGAGGLCGATARTVGAV